jgi:hypothetical protein
MIKTLIALTAIPAIFTLTNIAPAITAFYDNKKKVVIIQWQQKISGAKTFIIQRSADNFNWVDIARMENVNLSNTLNYQYNDSKPKPGENYYRLKSILQKNETIYSSSIMVITDNTDFNWAMYPVPVKDVLTLQYKGSKKITGVINVFIQSLQGKILCRIRSASNTTLIRIPVNNLGGGIYDIRIIVEDEVIWNQRLVK